jgi:aspartate kinase
MGPGGLRHVNYEDDVSAVAVVGGGMRGAKGIAARVFGAVASRGINVRMIAQGSSEQNISFVVHESDAKDAVRAVHRAFHLDRLNSRRPRAVQQKRNGE